MTPERTTDRSAAVPGGSHVPCLSVLALLAVLTLGLSGCVCRKTHVSTERVPLATVPPLPPLPQFTPSQIVEDAPQQSLLPPRTITNDSTGTTMDHSLTNRIMFMSDATSGTNANMAFGGLASVGWTVTNLSEDDPANYGSGTFIGMRAGMNATGGRPTMIGHAAGENAYKADYATLIGFAAGAGSTNTYNATLIGYRVGGQDNTRSDYRQSVMIGHEVGRLTTNFTTNVVIGTRAGETSENLSGSILIGHNVQATNLTNIVKLGGPEINTTYLQGNVTMPSNLYVTGSITGDLTGDVTGNADTATTATNLYRFPVDIGIAIGHETNSMVAASNVFTFYSPYQWTITNVLASVFTNVAASDVKIRLLAEGAAVLTTNVTISVGQKLGTNTTFSFTTITNRARLTVDIEQVGTGTTAPKLWLQGYRQ